MEHQEFSSQTTNNREELKAILYVLENYGNVSNNEIPTVYSDSAYAVNTITNWMYGWAKKGWIKSDNKIPENLDLIKNIYNLIQLGNKINLFKIKGHRGIAGNERADNLATGRIMIQNG